MNCPNCREPIDKVVHTYTQDIVEAISIVDRVEGPEPPRNTGDDEETLAILAALPGQRRLVTLDYDGIDDENTYAESFCCPNCDYDLELDTDWRTILTQIGTTIRVDLDAFTYDDEEEEDE